MTETETNSIRVLVVDDQRTMRQIIRRLLSQIGVRDVDDAEDGEQALKKLRSPTADKPDIVICDLHMEKMDAWISATMCAATGTTSSAPSRSSS